MHNSARNIIYGENFLFKKQANIKEAGQYQDRQQYNIHLVGDCQKCFLI